ncbi:dTDP-4-dehydrorhamnose reductase [Nevskia soli]|uniref:dTDP-4-dehydrorhamnose reductase n=1 Tax=Nevskia soli TaxID=418856 RepID=UPI00068DFAA2|nr:dTDP-4-dehydrorhamnose reductase [Nevskia soli]
MTIDGARILLLGRNGQVGHELLRTLAPLGEVIAADRATLDLCDESAIRALVRRVRPTLIVNAAAYTAVDKAESEPDLAFAVNARAPAVLAQEAAALGAWLVHYSTDYVFAGDKPQGAYLETDATGPINAYGRSKLAGEAAIAAEGGAHIILRTSWVYGAHGANFAKTIVRLAREREKLSIVADQIGAPTSSHLIAETTAQLIWQLAGAGEAAISGLYHLQSAGEASWYEFAGAIVEQLRAMDAAAVRCREILPIPASAYPTPARRPANSRLDCGKIARTFGLSLPHWRDDFGPRFREILGL